MELNSIGVRTRVRTRLLTCVVGTLLVMGVMPVKADPVDLKELDATVFERLRAKSSQHTDITLDGLLLKMAASFITSDGDEDVAKIKRLVSGLTSVTIRNFEFKKRGDYSAADIETIRTQIKSADWKRIIDTSDKEENESSEVYILPGKDKPQGLFVITAEPLELTVVHIMGTVDLKDIASLEHLHFGDDKDDK
jgi:hypothetical protein